MLDRGASATALYSQLLAYFRQRILDGGLAPGARLPTELKLAQEHQISRGTVRQALNALVTEGLIERVQGSGTFVRRTPPVQAQALQAAERRIGLVLNCLDGQLDLGILVGVEHAAKSRGYQVSFAYSEENLEQQARDIARLRDDRVAGLIILPVSVLTHDESIWRLHANNIPFVLVDRYFSDLDSDYVVADNLGGGYRATEHLLILGHRRIAFAYPHLGDLQTSSVHDRWLGYRKALEVYGMTYDDTLVFQNAPQPESSSHGTYDQLLSRPDRPSAIFAVNDFEALV